ncbi:MAG: hypothetical protein AAB692_02640, partial [Patescibacteria group bacterium]
TADMTHGRIKPKTSPGISLMETMTVIGVMAIVLVMISQIFVASYNTFVQQTARTDNETGAIIAGRTMADYSRGASSIMASQTIGGTVYATGDEVLVLKMPSIDSAGNVIALSYDYAAFAKDPSDATRIMVHMLGASGSRRLTGDRLVSAYNDVLKFRYNNADPTLANRIQIYLVNKQTKRTTTVVTKSWTAIFLRNQ